MQIGDRVRNKSLGFLIKGTITKVVEASTHKNWMEEFHLFKRWNVLYPGWENGKLCYIKLDEPRIQLRPDEIAEAKEHGLATMPDDWLPEHSVLAYPEADITLLID